MINGWAKVILGEVLQKTETVNPRDSPTTEFDYVDVSSVCNERFEITETQRLTGKEAPSRARRLIMTDDVIFATVRPTLRRMAIVPERLNGQVCSTGYTVLRPKRDLDHRFLFYSLFTDNFMDGMAALQKGASYPAVTEGEVRSQQIPLPPLGEQKRIVGILDEAFAGIAAAVANAEKNLANARELFESHLNAVFTRKGDGWVNATIEDHIKFIDYRGRTPKKTDSGLRLITAKNVKMGFLQREPEEFVSPGSYKAWMTRGIPQKGDVLFTTEAPLGNVAQLDSDEKLVFAQRIITLQSDRKVLDSTFLKYMLLSDMMQRRIHEMASGATAQGIKASRLKTIVISFPKSLDIQRQIVERLDNVAGESQRLESVYRRKLEHLAALKQSILHKAFAGELTPNSKQEANG